MLVEAGFKRLLCDPVQRRLPRRVTALPVNQKIPQEDTPVAPGFVKRQLTLFQELHEMRPRNPQQIGRTLSRQLLVFRDKDHSPPQLHIADSGGRDTTHAVLYALDPQTGDELYSSGDAIDSWNHYGGIAVSDGVVYLTTWDARIYAPGIKK